MKKRLLCASLLVCGLALLLVLPAKAFYLTPLGPTCEIYGIKFPGSCDRYVFVPQVKGEFAQQTCNVNGVEMPGSCDQYNNMVSQNQMQPMNGDQNQQPSAFNPSMGQEGTTQVGPNQEEMDKIQKEQQARQLQGMKNGIKQMKANLKQLETMIKNAEKKGTTISQEAKDKLAEAKSIIAKIESAQSSEELEDAGMDTLQEDMNFLEEYRRDVVEAAQRISDVKRGIKGMEQNVKMFDKQIVKLSKQKITIPTEVTENLTQLKSIISTVKNAKTWDEIEGSGFEDMPDLMQALDENRQQLEMLARWPQTLKQLNKELTNLDRQLKKSKSVADKLKKKGIDLTTQYDQFAGAIAKLKSVRDEAVSKIKEGDSEGAFDLLETDFFGQLEDTWQYQRVIEMMSNLGRFTSDYKNNLAQAQKQINMLKKKKIDIADLQDIYNQMKAKGGEIITLIKSKEIDEDTIISELDEMENLRQDFSDAVSELTGAEEEMPWEQGPQQFQKIEMSTKVSKYISQKPAQATPIDESNPQPSPLPVGESKP